MDSRQSLHIFTAEALPEQLIPQNPVCGHLAARSICVKLLCFLASSQTQSVPSVVPMVIIFFCWLIIKLLHIQRRADTSVSSSFNWQIILAMNQNSHKTRSHIKMFFGYLICCWTNYCKAHLLPGAVCSEQARLWEQSNPLLPDKWQWKHLILPQYSLWAPTTPPIVPHLFAKAHVWSAPRSGCGRGPCSVIWVRLLHINYCHVYCRSWEEPADVCVSAPADVNPVRDHLPW